MPELYRIRPVEARDAEQLAELYERLDTCNGSVDQVDAIIAESQKSLNERPFKRVTLVTEMVEDNPEAETTLVGTGSLIKVNSINSNDTINQAPNTKLTSRPLPPRRSTANLSSSFAPGQNPKTAQIIEPKSLPTMMYRDVAGGLQLVPYRTKAVEFAAVTTRDGWEGRGIGKSMTALRALLARKFSGVFGADNVIVEFLPQYDEKTTTNAFWEELILSSLKEADTLDALMKFCSKETKKEITKVEELPHALAIELSNGDRNEAINKYFPSFIMGNKISAQARKVSRNVGRKTQGALINLQTFYGSSAFDRIGHFAIDGGPNYSAKTQYGAPGEKTVPTEFTDSSLEDARTMRESSETAIVYKPVANTLAGLRSLIAIVTPGIFDSELAKLPRDIQTLLELEDGEEITYFKLPQSTRTHRP
ncbi:hypothetical protein JKY72_02080 [Candidatus Gracilibacteria bacterium]|nr:hypothetical protein [Candidatus Gracilibacteria bacterium]